MADRVERIIIDIVTTSAINNARKVAVVVNDVANTAEKATKRTAAAQKKALAEVAAINAQTKKSAEKFAKDSIALDDKLTAQRIANANKSAKAAADSFLRHLNQVNSSEKNVKTLNPKSVFMDYVKQSSFLGSFVGAGAGGGLALAAQKLFSTLSSGIGTLKDLSIEAVKAGGNYQIIKNSLEVAAGSARLANLELAGINQTAKNTAGLRLETAEQGYTNLRNLGFSAKLAKGFIKELAEEKILSGANEDAMQRVTFNFAQIASGGQKVSQELREILTALPSLRTSFYEAFGSLSPQKIQQFFDEDSDKAFQRLVDAMARGKAAAGGLNDGVGKLEDAWLEAQRSFSEPTLEPLTKILKDLTKDINDNEGVFRTWGNNVATILDLIANKTESKFVSAIFKIEDYTERLALLTLSMGATGGASPSELGRGLKSKFDEANRLLGFYQTGVYMPDASQFQPSFKGAKKWLDNISQGETASERAKRLANEEFENQQKIEKSRVKSLEFSKYTRDQQIQLSENYYAIESARLSSYTAKTLTEELGFQKALGKTKSDGIRSQIAIQNAYYAATFPKLAGDKEETIKLTIEKNKALSDLNRQLVENEFQTQKQIFDTERQITKERLDAIIESKKLSADAIRRGMEVGSFNSDRSLTLLGYSPQLFNEAKDTTIKGYAELMRITSEQYKALLQNDTLTAEHRVNIQRQMQAEQAGLAEEQRRKMLEIGDRQYSGFIHQLETYQKRVSQLYQSSASSYSAIGGLFNPDTFSSNTAKTIRETLLQTGKLADLQKQLSASRTAENTLGALITNRTAETDVAKLNDAFGSAVSKSVELQEAIRKLGNSIPDTYQNFALLGDQIGKGNVKAFDDATKAALIYRQKLEKTALDSEIAGVGDLLTVATNEKRDADIKTYKQKLSELNLDKFNQDMRHASESTQQYEKSLEGLQNRITQMRSGDKSAFAGLDYLNQQKILSAQIDDITSAYNRETDAVISLNRVKSELLSKGFFSQNQSDAIFLEEMNSRIKSTNQVVAEFKLGIADGFVSPVESLFDRINDKIDKLPAGIREVTGAFSNLFQEITKQAANQFVMRLLGFDTGGSFGMMSSGAGQSRGGSNFSPLNFAQQALMGDRGNSFMPGEMGGMPTGYGGLGNGVNLLSKIPVLGRLLGFGGSKAASAASTILTPDKVTGAAESMLNLGGSSAAAGGAGGLGSMFGSLGPLMTNPWTLAAVGAGIGGYFLFRHLLGDKSEKRLKEAVQMDYGIKIGKDDAKILKTIGEQQLGAGAGEKRPHEVIKLEEAKNLIRAIGEQQGKDTSRLGIDKARLTDENYSANRFTVPFGGYREFGGSVRPNMAYVVGERRPELFVPQTSGTIIPSIGSSDNIKAIVQEAIRPYALLLEQAMMTLAVNQETNGLLANKINAIPPNHVVTLADARVIGDKVIEAGGSQGFQDRFGQNTAVGY